MSKMRRWRGLRLVHEQRGDCKHKMEKDRPEAWWHEAKKWRVDDTKEAKGKEGSKKETIN